MFVVVLFLTIDNVMWALHYVENSIHKCALWIGFVACNGGNN